MTNGHTDTGGFLFFGSPFFPLSVVFALGHVLACFNFMIGTSCGKSWFYVAEVGSLLGEFATR